MMPEEIRNIQPTVIMSIITQENSIHIKYIFHSR